MPPVQAGIVPAALPAFSAPTGVRSLPSRAACWADTAATAIVATPAAARSPRRNGCFSFRMVTPAGSERVLDGRGDEVAVAQLVVAAPAAENRVAQVHLELRLVAAEHADSRAVAVLDEVAARPGPRALDVVRPDEPRREIPLADQAQVIEAERRAIAPGVGVGEAVLRLHFVEVTARERGVAGHRGARAVEAEPVARRPAGQLLRHALDVGQA